MEGLTVTYFRRATDVNATLMQMGRWLGFRQGFRDLVRLYIAKRARFGKREMDLYDAFVGVALDEAAFRDQLKLYAGGGTARSSPARSHLWCHNIFRGCVRWPRIRCSMLSW